MCLRSVCECVSVWVCVCVCVCARVHAYVRGVGINVLLKGSQPACWCSPPWATLTHSRPLWLKSSKLPSSNTFGGWLNVLYDSRHHSLLHIYIYHISDTHDTTNITKQCSHVRTLGLEAQSYSCGLLSSLPHLDLFSSKGNGSLIHTSEAFTQYLVQA